MRVRALYISLFVIVSLVAIINASPARSSVETYPEYNPDLTNGIYNDDQVHGNLLRNVYLHVKYGAKAVTDVGKKVLDDVAHYGGKVLNAIGTGTEAVLNHISDRFYVPNSSDRFSGTENDKTLPHDLYSDYDNY